MSIYVSLAKLAVENYVKEGKVVSLPTDLPKELLTRRAGIFVTIEKSGKLRGCIGTYLPTRINIAEEIIRNANAAATEDYRFDPVKKDELSELSYTVYVLSTPQPVKDVKKELNPKKYGIIIKTFPLIFPNQPNQNQDVVFNGHLVPKTGLLLPDLEGVDTIEEQISITCQKGGIDPEKEKIIIYKFTVKEYK